MSYQVGDLVRATGTFTNAALAPIDPSAVFGQYRDPSGNTTTLTYGVDAALVRDSQGIYHIDIKVDEPRNWHYRFYSTGTGQAANEASFHVVGTEFD